MTRWHVIGMVFAATAALAQFTPRKPVPDRLDLPTLTKDMCNHPGRTFDDGALPEPQDLALDGYCADVIIERSAPHGFVTIFGSARTKAGTPAYEMVYDFAKKWTLTAGGKRWPIATGGGPGIM